MKHIAHEDGRAEMVAIGSIAIGIDTAAEAEVEIGTESGEPGTETTRTTRGRDETTEATGTGAEVGVERLTGTGSTDGLRWLEAGAAVGSIGGGAGVETGRG